MVRARLASPALLAKADLCILTDVAVEPRPGKVVDVLPSDFAAALGPFVRQGHGLIIFAGNNVVPAAYNRVLGKKVDVLPMPLTRMVKTHPKERLFLNRDTFNRPAFEAFREDKRYAVFGAVGAWQMIELQTPTVKLDENGKERPQQGVLLRYENNQPAVVARSVDAGEVVFVTTAAHSHRFTGADGIKGYYEWTNWADLPVFVPFVHTLINTLMHGQSEVYNVTAGEVLHWYPSDRTSRSYTLVHPDGRVTRLGQPEKKGRRFEVTADDLPRAGVYHLVAHVPQLETEPPETQAPGAKDRGIPIAAAPDLAETADLSTFDDAEIDGQIGFAPIHLIADSGVDTLSAADRLNREWTSWLLIGILLLLACEAAMAWVCGRAW